MAASNVKFSDTINVKNHISNMLIYFHLYWLDIKQDIADHSSYLNKMSVLLNVYIDMELKTSIEKRTFSHVKDSSKIAAKILATLYIYLGNSEEHIFRVLLRIKHAMEKYKKICDYLFMKSFTNLTTKTMFVTDIAYIRYLLAFKMWKKMEGDTDKKKRINKLALMLLGSRMPKLRNELLEVVPIPPADQENETLWLLKPNLFDLKQAHQHFLLFEDKIDNFASLQCTKAIHAGQSYLMSQKIQMNLCRSNLNGDEANHEINKDHLDGLRNCNVKSSSNGNKSMDQTYLQKKARGNLKPLKKMKKKSGKIIIIDLTGDDEISVPYKIKRKKAKQDLEYLKIMKKKHKSQKHINTLKCSSRLMIAKTQPNSNKDSKNSDDKVCLDYKPISDNKVSDSTESYAPISNRSSLNDAYRINFQKNEHLNITKNQTSNVCPKIVKEDEMQHNYNSHYSKIPKFFDQSIKEFNVTANALRENKSESHVSSHVSCAIEDTANLYSNPIMQSKEILTSQEDSATGTIPLFKMCQSNNADQHSFKQESPTSTDCSTRQKTQKCCEAVPVDMHDIKHLLIKKSVSDHNSQITEIIKQKVCHQVNECPNCCTKIDCKLLVFTNNDVAAVKTQDTLHNMFNQNENDVKSACDTNIICMLSDRNKCVYVVNHIGECVVTTHTEKKMQCLDKSNDMCAVSSTFTGDQIVEPPLYSQHINLENMRANDYRNAAKYSETTMKKQQRRSNCDTSISNDRIYSLDPPCAFDINSFKIGSNAEIDYETQLKNFPKTEEANKVTKTGCMNDSGNMNFLNNIQNGAQEDFLRQSSTMSPINYDNTIDIPIRKSFVCTDNDVTTVKTRDTLHDTFGDNENDVKSTCDTNTIYMFSDRNKCVHITNRIGECVMNAEKRMRYLDNPNDMCTVSTTFTEDQIVGSSLDGQHVNYDNARASVYGNGSKYSEATMKERQGRSDCDTSMLNNRLHSSCTFDINSFEIDSKEANEMMKTDCTDDLESISFRHNIKSLEEILEDVLRQPSLMSQQMSYDSSSSVFKDLEENIFSAVSDNTHTADFLSLKQSFELNGVYYNMLPDVSGFGDDQGLQSPAQRECFARDDRKTTSPKQFEKVSWTPSTSWCQF